MRKLLNKPWFVAALVLAASALVGFTLLSGDPVRVGAPLVASDEAIPSELPRMPAAAALAALAILPDAPNPFAPRARPEASGAKLASPDLVDQLHLSAIWTQDRATYVLINGRIIVAGEGIGRVTVESATQEGVWLTHWKGRDFLSLGGDFTLTTPVSGAL